MPYISSEDVKAKRTEIRKAFPSCKFSVTKDHHSGINVYILSGPLPPPARAVEHRGHFQVNHFCIERSFADDPAWAILLKAVHEIASRGKRELVYDADYGSVPTFYSNISIGRWDRPYAQVAA